MSADHAAGKAAVHEKCDSCCSSRDISRELWKLYLRRSDNGSYDSQGAYDERAPYIAIDYHQNLSSVRTHHNAVLVPCSAKEYLKELRNYPQP